MKSKLLDKKYLSLQFRDKIYSKNGSEFQSFFENIMEKAFLDFQKIRPYGNMGDGGNDGYRKKEGIYYQVNAPINPQEKEAKAAKKLKNNFQKLKTNWDKISSIKKYIFVFNDKNGGSVQLLEQAVSELNNENPDIDFELFLTKDLEKLFFQLDESDILNLGFDIDSREAISNVYEYLQKVQIELDRENAKFALKILENSKDIISKLNDENLLLEYEILECRCFQKLEKICEAKEKYENICKRFPNDPRAFLYLAEIYLNDKDFDKNKELLEKAKKIDNNHWLLKLEELGRKNHLRKKIDVVNIKEKTFPDDSRIKANFYRLYALFFEDSGDKTNANSFIEKAIDLNPNRFGNFIIKLSLIESRLLSNKNISQTFQESQKLLEEIKKVENKFFEYGDIGARNKAILNIKKLNVFRIQENYSKIEKISQETFKLSITCYFDKQIDQILTGLLMFVLLPDNDFNQLLEYLKNSKKEISEELLKVLIFQFNIKDDLFVKGKKFFKEINNQKYFDFIVDVENKNYKNILKFLENDNQFAVAIANTTKNSPDLRIKIIENLPDDKNIQKDKLLLLLNFDEKNFDKAFEILKQTDLTNLGYLECKPILKIIQEKKAWDFEVIVLKKLLEKERDEKEKFNLKLQLFNACLNLKKYPEAMNMGEKLLKQDLIKNILDQRNREVLLIHTIIACLERGKVEKEAFKKSKEILEKYQPTEPTFEFKVNIEAEVYFRNDKPDKALESVIEGIKIKKVLTPKEYAELYFVISIRIGNQINLKLDSLNKIEKNTFVKFKNEDRWYFIGNDNELDATKISKENDKYLLFINQTLGGKIVFRDRYSSKKHEEIIESIFSIDQYILWQTFQNFQKLSKDNILEGVQMIEVPQKGETIDFKYLLKLLEDLHKKTEPFFEMYCNNNFPLAILAVNEGGLTNAIGRIQQENKGFINFSTGTIKEIEKQKDIVKNIIDKKIPFYIDGTSALILSEMGLLQKVYTFLPNLKVPQSVINLLADITEKFRYMPGQVGHMGYAQGKISSSTVKKNERDLIQSNFLESIKLLESKSENISVISSANKANCFSEQKIPAELSDACILAQKENLVVLTEDFLYLKINELETKKKSPEYFSSLVLLRVLYEKGKISFDEYLDFFGYLSSYRFRFLSLGSDDIEKAVFGDGKIKIVSPENIRKLNFSLTLSEEYGVPFQKAFTVVGGFLLKVLMDDTVTTDIVEKIFIEIIETFPTKINKKDFGQMLLRVCLRAIENNKSKFVLYSRTQLIHKKVDKLLQVTEIYNLKAKLWTSNTE